MSARTGRSSRISKERNEAAFSVSRQRPNGICDGRGLGA
jgi:hypothetical protein